MQAQPPCQTPGAAATRAALVVAVGNMVWARGSGPAQGSLIGEAGWESPSSALTLSQRGCRSSEMSTEQGAFDTWLVIWGLKQENAGTLVVQRKPPIHRHGRSPV